MTSFSGVYFKEKPSLTSFKNSDVNFSIFDENNPYFHMIEAIKNAFPLKDLKILDVGCGRERKYQILGFKLAKLGCNVTGIDLECRSESVSGGPKFVRAPIESFLPKEKFNVIVSSFFFGYVSADWAKGNGMRARNYEIIVLKKLHGLLDEGGVCVHYLNEDCHLAREDIESVGFEILKFPRPSSNPANGLLVLKK